MGERADESESAAARERAAVAESAEAPERAGHAESAEATVRVEKLESIESAERPRYSPGYPRIEASTHHLWNAQQAGWPAHLPHEAWQQMALSRLDKDQQPRASSADHPAFAAAYVPNYAATQEKPLNETIVQPVSHRPRR